MPTSPPVTIAAALTVAVGVAFAAALLVRHRRLAARFVEVDATNRELRESAVRKDEFLASVSHELRTPLNVVMGYVDLLLDHSFGSLEPAQRDILHRITKNASNLSHLINDLLDLARVEAGRMPVEMDVVDLGPLFADLSAVMDVLLAGHDVTFEAAIAADCGHVRADPARLKQIVSNLLVNAVKFTERGTIALRASVQTSGQVAIAVRDTGIGIPLADQRMIFEPFRQAHDREHRAPGAGIGLSISSRLAVLMGGTLGVESAPGAGSTFTLVLHAAANTADDAPPYDLRAVS
jgi:signal transduction histidine kinase